jgi:hypothetical protein
MEYERSEGTFAIRSADLRGGTSGGVYRRERITKKMGREKSKQPQARRDSSSDLRGSLHGNQGDTEAATDPTASGIETTNTAPSEPIPTETRWMGSAKVDSRIVEVSDSRTVKARRYTPPNCSMCMANRPPDTSYVFVYHTRTENGYIVRYCKCGNCPNTFKDAQKITPLP